MDELEEAEFWPRRVLITGSRDWADALCLQQALDAARDELGRFILISGACPTGADMLGEQWASMRGHPIERHPADWQAFGKRAGPIRNQAMVDAGADLCVAFIRNGSRGATHTAERAEAAGIPTRRFVN